MMTPTMFRKKRRRLLKMKKYLLLLKLALSLLRWRCRCCVGIVAAAGDKVGVANAADDEVEGEEIRVLEVLDVDQGLNTEQVQHHQRQFYEWCQKKYFADEKCTGDNRCKCYKAGQKCTSHCHSKFKETNCTNVEAD
jgi:hypothetical protein